MTALPWRISLSALAVWSVLSSLFLTATAESPRPLPVAPAPCVSAEDCFRSAVALNERSGSPVQRDQTMMLKIDQLRSVMELYPSTIWAKRAGVVLGVLRIEREPVEAAKLLRVVQPDMPVLDDYLRLWIGESLLKQNEPIQAAELLETIPKIVPDSSLIAKAAYRTGEAWYSANVCFRAVDWLERAVALADKDPAASLALWHLAECYIRENRLPEARTALKQLWLRYPHSPEAREAKARLDTALGGESWTPTAEDHSIRAQAFLGLALQTGAVERKGGVLGGGGRDPVAAPWPAAVYLAAVWVGCHEQGFIVGRRPRAPGRAEVVPDGLPHRRRDGAPLGLAALCVDAICHLVAVDAEIAAVEP